MKRRFVNSTSDEGYRGPIRQPAQLGVSELGLQSAKAGECAETTIGPGDDPLALHNIRQLAEALGNKVGMLHEVAHAFRAC